MSFTLQAPFNEWLTTTVTGIEPGIVSLCGGRLTFPNGAAPNVPLTFRFILPHQSFPPQP